MTHLTLLLSCLDRPGIVNHITGVLLNLGANIIDANQHIMDEQPKLFYIRIEFTVINYNKNQMTVVFDDIAQNLEASVQWFEMNKPLTCSILVSKEDHCLEDILYQWKSSGLGIRIESIISNHDVYHDVAARYNLPFHFISSRDKKESESQVLTLVKNIDFLVLARYMQVVSPDFLAEYKKPIVNIHHSFLPSFSGAKPYHQAYERGVKLIGATAHFVTEDLDAGPILVQNVAPITHRYSIQELKMIGQSLEKQTLVEAIHYISKHRVMVHGNKTIIF